MNIGVYIETGGVNTLITSDSIIDQLAALDQAESQSRSENVKFGMRRRMESGRTLLNHTQFLDYTKGEDAHEPIIDKEIFKKVQKMKGRINKQEQCVETVSNEVQTMVLR